jgi:tagatose-1,6-bisphosphate aldolase
MTSSEQRQDDCLHLPFISLSEGVVRAGVFTWVRGARCAGTEGGRSGRKSIVSGEDGSCLNQQRLLKQEQIRKVTQ